MDIKFLFPTCRAFINFLSMVYLLLCLLLFKDFIKPEVALIYVFMVFYFLNEWSKEMEKELDKLDKELKDLEEVLDKKKPKRR